MRNSILILIFLALAKPGLAQEPISIASYSAWNYAYGLLWLDNLRFVVNSDTGIWLLNTEDLELSDWHLATRDVLSMAVDSNAEYLALSYQNRFEVWSIAVPELISTIYYEFHLLEGRTHSFSFSPDNQYLVLGHPNLSGIVVWDWAAGDLLAHIAQTAGVRVNEFHWAEDGGLWTASGEWSVNGAVWQWDLENFRGEEILNLQQERTGGLAFSPDLEFIIYDAHEKTQIRSLQTGELLFSEENNYLYYRMNPHTPYLLALGAGNLVELRLIQETGLSRESIILHYDTEQANLSRYLFAEFEPSGETVLILLENKVELWEVPDFD